MENSNTLIEASAGTGKTQALANHLIDLLRQGVNPCEIIALTFSRAAAGEIFQRFVSLLADESERDSHVLELLRQVIATQHLSQIGTLDGFLLRLVRSFPLELGCTNSFSIMDEYQAHVEQERVLFSLLRSSDEQRRDAFLKTLELINDGSWPVTFFDKLQEKFSASLSLYWLHPNVSLWGEAAQISSQVQELVGYADLSIEEDLQALETLYAHDKKAKEWTKFFERVRAFDGRFKSPETGFFLRLLQAKNLLSGNSLSFTYYKKPIELDAVASDHVRRIFSVLIGRSFVQMLHQVKGLHAFLSIFDEAYDELVRRSGKLVFNDVPHLIQRLDAQARLALEYRMDMKIRAWALDEFQDTSREQWASLKELLEEAKQSAGEKSVFLVGDRKQAIYGWRNGDVSIFRAQHDSHAYTIQELKKSYRFGFAITQCVNQIFATGPLKDDFGFESPIHETAFPKREGFVQRLQLGEGIPDEEGATDVERYANVIIPALKAVNPVARGLSVAILVRANEFGEALTDALKKKGLEQVVWEGESNLLNTPALLPFLDLVKLADHPGDEKAYHHFCQSPLARAKYRTQQIPSAAELSAETAHQFATRGLARTLRDWRDVLPSSSEEAWSPFTEERFTALLAQVAAFESMSRVDRESSELLDFLSCQSMRTVAEPGQIKVMTIHRSKGLGFDYVILPLKENDGMDTVRRSLIATDRWVLHEPIEAISSQVDGVREGVALTHQNAIYERLCMYYVACTRAKQALLFVLDPPSESSQKVYFSDYVRRSIPDRMGDPHWYESFTHAEETSQQESSTRAPLVRGPRSQVRRRTPSHLYHPATPASDLFVSTRNFQTAKQQGIEEHRALEQVEWMDAPVAPTPFDEAFIRPNNCVDLWREKAYERFVEGTWETGQFDRVVFTQRADGTREAIIYDFKTNAIQTNESQETFLARMRSTYSAQMQTYRDALATLTSIPSEHIRAELLFPHQHEWVLAL